MPYSPTENVHDPTVEFNRREYFTTHAPVLEVPDMFQHTRPAGEPAKPAYPADPTAAAEVLAYLDYGTAVAHADAITWVAAYTTWWDEWHAWKHADDTARKTQYRVAFGDALIYNKATLPASGDTGGTGSSPPPAAVAPRNDP